MTVFIDDCPKGIARNHNWREDGTCASCGGAIPPTEVQFAQRLEGLLNRHSQENASNTPDFILTQFLLGCRAAWNQGVQQRETWYGRDARPTGGTGTVPIDAESHSPAIGGAPQKDEEQT